MLDDDVFDEDDFDEDEGLLDDDEGLLDDDDFDAELEPDGMFALRNRLLYLHHNSNHLLNNVLCVCICVGVCVYRRTHLQHY